MKFYAAYDAIGVIQQLGQCDDVAFEMLLELPEPIPGLDIVEIGGNDPEFLTRYYVADRVLTPRVPMAPTVSATDIAADGEAVTAITGLPVPCTFSVAGPVAHPPTELADGDLEFTADVAGDYTITVTAPPGFQVWKIVIHAY